MKFIGRSKECDNDKGKKKVMPCRKGKPALICNSSIDRRGKNNIEEEMNQLVVGEYLEIRNSVSRNR